MNAHVSVLYEDNHCIAVSKPAGLLSQGDASGSASVVDLVKADLKTRYAKPGNVYLGLVHRLDRPVSGVMLLAKTSKAAARLTEQFREGKVEKVYWALVEGRPGVEAGEWVDMLRKDQETNRVEVSSDAGARQARLAFQVIGRPGGLTWLELTPRTGRSHQIRVQLASRGFPIVGDRKYGARSEILAEDGKPRIALHAWRLGFTHPTRREWLEVTAEVPSDWPGPRSRPA
jgi:23S rRNA pseudouridine1911/1915/1917 synthase